jgi:hypothetical protein
MRSNRDTCQGKRVNLVRDEGKHKETKPSGLDQNEKIGFELIRRAHEVRRNALKDRNRLKSFVPCAFLATLSRSNNTIILKTCDMSPARRKMFMDMVNQSQ